GDRQGEREVEDGDGQGQPERGGDGAVLEAIAEEARIVRIPDAVLRGQRIDDAIEEGIDEQRDHDGDARQHEQRRAIDAARGKARAERRPAHCASPRKTSARPAAGCSFAAAPRGRWLSARKNSSDPSPAWARPKKARPRYSMFDTTAGMPSPSSTATRSSGRTERTAASPGFSASRAIPARRAPAASMRTSSPDSETTRPARRVRKPMKSATSAWAGRW